MELKDALQELYGGLGKAGVFITAGTEPNTMTASWGGTGIMWKKPVFAAPVRFSRYTYGKIAETGEFSVSIPAPGALGEELAYFGTKSGRDVDKYKVRNIVPVPCREIGTCVIPGCAKYLECRVLYRSDLRPDQLPERYNTAFYRDHD